MSSPGSIRFENVTKNYRLARITSGGLKNALLHLPKYLRQALSHKPFCALREVSFEVGRGECLGIIGKNGSGKSTTLGLIAGVLRPSSGKVEASGRICPLLELGAGFNFELTGKENILLNGILLGMTRAEVLARMEAIIAFSELGDFIHRPVRVYSSGMFARLGFSVAVHLQPDILLVDEVLAVGDEAFQKKCLDKMQEFHARGTTMVFVSHDLESVRQVCDRALLLGAGRVVEIGPPEAVIETYHRTLKN